MKSPRNTQPLTLRLTVRNPVPGVVLRVQRGRDALVPPVVESADAVVFELEIEAEVKADGRVVCRGPAVQGPPAARFIYVNAGTYAGQSKTAVGRRAKVPLEISSAVVAAARARLKTVVAAAIDGRARDGGPAAATVPLLGGGWQLHPRDA